MNTTRRDLLGYGFGSLLFSACGARHAAAHPLLEPTPQLLDDDDGPLPPVPGTAGSCEATADNIEGPFYKPGAPHRAELAKPEDPGERLVISGVVASTDCVGLANVALDVWHADARGAYDNDGWGMRGQLVTDADGRFEIRSILPGRYLNGRRFRPMHVHVKLRAEGRRALTTQLYFAGDEYIAGDAFVVPSLIMPHERIGDTRRARFRFVLAPE